jgi:hypothetical protein
MELWLVAASVIAAVAAVWLAVQIRQLVEASQEQLYSQQLPVLVPIEPLISADYRISDNFGGYNRQRNPGYDRSLTYATIAIRNSGPGIALNIWGVVFEAEPELVVHKQTGQRHSHHYALPLEPGKDIKVEWTAGGLPMNGDAEIGATIRYKLFAPGKPTSAESQHGETEKVARLTLTYSDIFGRKHAAVYDFTAQNQWETVAYLRNIAKDLSDLEREVLSQVPVYGAPSVPRELSQ